MDEPFNVLSEADLLTNSTGARTLPKLIGIVCHERNAAHERKRELGPFRFRLLPLEDGVTMR